MNSRAKNRTRSNHTRCSEVFRTGTAIAVASAHLVTAVAEGDENEWGLKASIFRLVSVRTLPQSPEQLLEELFAIFPQYRARYPGPIHDDAPTFHSVLMAFTPFFGGEAASLSEAQLCSFGALVSAAIAAGGPLENAFSTCLLEHLRQVRASRERTRP